MQNLNELNAEARTGQHYVQQLHKFHSTRLHKDFTIPVLRGDGLDLYKLKVLVQNAGGHERTSLNRLWTDITRRLGYDKSVSNPLSQQVKVAYRRIISPYEIWRHKMREAHPSGGEYDSDSDDSHEDPPSGKSKKADKKNTGKKQPTRRLSDQPKLQSSYSTGVKLQTLHGTHHGGRQNHRSPSRPSNPPPSSRSSQGPGPSVPPQADRRHKPDTALDLEHVFCTICGSGESAESMLLCDDCDRGFHMNCLDPAVDHIPPGEWYCDECLMVLKEDFGFEDGDTHSLFSFYMRSEEFRRSYWSKHQDAIQDGKLAGPSAALFPASASTSASSANVKPKGETKPGTDTQTQAQAQAQICSTDVGTDEGEQAGSDDGDNKVAKELNEKPKQRPRARVAPIARLPHSPSEFDVEAEFWRLTECRTETVEVEYGADIDAVVHGSPAPTLETHPLDPCSRSPWNLNNLPMANGSLLRYLQSGVAGMTSPFVYIGMLFSTFCWHMEDHFSYSINYQHLGHTKTWYGVPASDSTKFETVLRKYAPDLFEGNPDILFQLVTLFSPEILREEGVSVYALDQRAGEFVITFPQAFHAGFNHGFNVNEAVNFLLPDWVNMGWECVQTYRQIVRQPAFSHDQLLWGATVYGLSVQMAQRLVGPLKEVVQRQLEWRKRIRNLGHHSQPNVFDEADQKGRKKSRRKSRAEDSDDLAIEQGGGRPSETNHDTSRDNVEAGAGVSVGPHRQYASEERDVHISEIITHLCEAEETAQCALCKCYTYFTSVELAPDDPMFPEADEATRTERHGLTACPEHAYIVFGLPMPPSLAGKVLSLHPNAMVSWTQWAEEHIPFLSLVRDGDVSRTSSEEPDEQQDTTRDEDQDQEDKAVPLAEEHHALSRNKANSSLSRSPSSSHLNPYPQGARKLILRQLYNDDMLRDQVSLVESRAAVVDDWVVRYRTTMYTHARPDIDLLRDLMKQAQDICLSHVDEARHLAQFLQQAEDWLVCASEILGLQKAPLDPRILLPLPEMEDDLEEAGARGGVTTLGQVEDLVAEVQLLPFSSPTIYALQDFLEKTQEVAQNVSLLLARTRGEPPPDTNGGQADQQTALGGADRSSAKELLNRISTLNVAIPGAGALATCLCQEGDFDGLEPALAKVCRSGLDSIPGEGEILPPPERLLEDTTQDVDMSHDQIWSVPKADAVPEPNGQMVVDLTPGERVLGSHSVHSSVSDLSVVDLGSGPKPAPAMPNAPPPPPPPPPLPPSSPPLLPSSEPVPSPWPALATSTDWMTQAEQALKQPDPLSLEQLETLLSTSPVDRKSSKFDRAASMLHQLDQRYHTVLEADQTIAQMIHGEEQDRRIVLGRTASDDARSADDDNCLLDCKLGWSARMNQARSILASAARTKVTSGPLVSLQLAVRNSDAWLWSVLQLITSHLGANPLFAEKQGELSTSSLYHFSDRIFLALQHNAPEASGPPLKKCPLCIRPLPMSPAEGPPPVECIVCQTPSHAQCASTGLLEDHQRPRPPSFQGYVCDVCDAPTLRQVLLQRHAVPIQSLVKLDTEAGRLFRLEPGPIQARQLLQHKGALQSLTLPPVELFVFRSCSKKAFHFGEQAVNAIVALRPVTQSGVQMTLAHIRHILRQALLLPIDLVDGRLLPVTGTLAAFMWELENQLAPPQDHPASAARSPVIRRDSTAGPAPLAYRQIGRAIAPPGRSAPPSLATPHRAAVSASGAPVRARKAELVFAEQPSPDAPNEMCLCYGKGAGELIACALCQGLFHLDCVHVSSPRDSFDTSGRWFCPMCCLKNGREYPFVQTVVLPVGM